MEDAAAGGMGALVGRGGWKHCMYTDAREKDLSESCEYFVVEVV